MLAGAKFKGIAGGYFKFIDNDKVDVGTAFQVTTRTGTYSRSNLGDIPDILAGNYSLVGQGPNWTVRISTVMHGAHRVDEYHLRPSGKNATLTLFGGADPLPTLVEGKLEK